MRRICIGALVFACALPGAGPAQAARGLQGPPGKSFRKVLVIGTDGTRWDLVKQAMQQGKAPNLKHLMDEGVGGPTLLPYGPPDSLTLSEVGWSTIATGVGPSKHGIHGFKLNKDPGQATKNGYLDFLARAKRSRPALSTFLSSDWANIGLHKNGGPIFSDAGTNARYTLDAADTIDSYDSGDASDAAVAANYLRRANPDAGFVYLGVVDETAHAVGSATPDYRAAIARTDKRVGQMLDAIRSRPNYGAERWTVIVTTDHGQQNFNFGSLASHGGGTQLERTSFVIASGPGIPGSLATKSPGVVDINPTVQHQLGLPVSPSWNLDGRSFVSGPAPSKPPSERVTLRLRGGKPALDLVVQAHGGAPRMSSARLALPKGLALKRSTRKRPAARLRVDGRLRRAGLSSRAIRITRTGKRFRVRTRPGKVKISRALLRRLRKGGELVLSGRVAESGSAALPHQVYARVRR